MIKTRVTVDTSGMPRFRARMHRGAARGVEAFARRAHAEIVAAAPRGDGSSGVLPGHMADTIKIWPVKRRRGKEETAIYSYDPTAVWQDQGTLGKRRRKLAKATLRRRSTASGQSRLARVSGHPGVKPRRFFAKGVRAAGGGAGVVAAIKVALGGVSR
jgi:hypothetical protein